MALPNKTKIPVGFVLSGKYRITREIGRGGMAAVYEAENIDIGKRVAIKVLAQELTASAVVVERFLREARAAAAIRSPYICDVYDSGRLEDGRPFLVLELLEGDSLYERMTKIRHLDVETTLTVITQACRGLTKAHAASIVHRDLKPENIFLTKDEEGKTLAKILDFGLAKFYAPMQGSGGEKQVRLTREGAVFGTPAYMSPEQVRGQGAVDHRADLWALACITYECLTGKTVWATEQGVAMTFAQIANAPLPRPNKLRPDLPMAFTDWFDKALDRKIEKRFQTAKEFAEELSAAFEQGPPSFSAIHPLEDLGLPELSSSMGAASAMPADQTPTKRMGVGDAVAAAASGTARAAPNGRRQDFEVPVVFSDEPTSPSSAAQNRGSKAGFVAPKRTSDPTTDTQTSKPTAPDFRPAGPGRTVAIVGAGLLIAGVAYASYQHFILPQQGTLPTSSVNGDAGVAPSGSTDGGAAAVVAPAPGPLPWRPLVLEAQAMIAADNLKGAQKLLKDAFDKGGHGVPRTMLDHVQVALNATSAKQACKLTGLGRPRTYDLTSAGAKVVGGGRPSIAMGARGPVMTWTDAHDGSEHAYAVVLDDALRSASDPFDVTPEGTAIGRPEVTAAGDKLLLTYWDAKGSEAGVHVRWLDANGRIAGPAMAVAPSKGGNFWPSAVRIEDGSFFVAWSNEEGNSEDLFIRRLSPKLEPSGDVLRATDLVPTGGAKPRARLPWVAAQGDAVYVTFRVERDPTRLIQLMRLPIADAAKGLPPAPKNAPRADRTMGETLLVNTDKEKADSPAIGCGAQGCFVTWHGEQAGGSSAAFVEPGKAQPLWRKKFSKVGGDTNIAVSNGGEAQLVWFERGAVMTASIGRDGVGPVSKVARISGDQPMPSIAAGAKPGEWYLAWLDFETGHLEPYAARVLCR